MNIQVNIPTRVSEPSCTCSYTKVLKTDFLRRYSDTRMIDPIRQDVAISEIDLTDTRLKFRMNINEDALKAKAESIPGKALEKARSVACDSNLNQCKQSIDMEAQDLGGFPLALPADTAPIAKCPDSGQPYQYDPTTGRVWCPYHQPS